MNKKISGKEPVVHILKLRQPYFDSVADGSKTFEVRYNDRDYKKGDILALCEIDEEGRYKERMIIKTISYVLDNYEGLQPEWCILGLGTIKSCKWTVLKKIGEMAHLKFSDKPKKG